MLLISYPLFLVILLPLFCLLCPLHCAVFCFFCSSVMFVWLDCFFFTAPVLYCLLPSMSCHMLFFFSSCILPITHQHSTSFSSSHFFLFLSAPHGPHLHTRFCLYPVAGTINQSNSPTNSPVNQSSGPTTSPVNRSLLLYWPLTKKQLPVAAVSLDFSRTCPFSYELCVYCLKKCCKPGGVKAEWAGPAGQAEK